MKILLRIDISNFLFRIRNMHERVCRRDDLIVDVPKAYAALIIFDLVYGTINRAIHLRKASPTGFPAPEDILPRAFRAIPKVPLVVLGKSTLPVDPLGLSRCQL